jgi:hypothetical protein
VSRLHDCSELVAAVNRLGAFLAAHREVYIYIYIYVCVCVYVCMYIYLVYVYACDYVGSSGGDR